MNLSPFDRINLGGFMRQGSSGCACACLCKPTLLYLQGPKYIRTLSEILSEDNLNPREAI